MKKLIWLAVAFLVVPSLSFGALEDFYSIYAKTGDGKTALENKCSRCHPFNVPLSQTLTAEEWEEKFSKMAAVGAVFNSEEKKLVYHFLTAKASFEEACADCHSKNRCLSRQKSPEEWLGTVKKMSLKSEGGLSSEEIYVISSYLATICPEK